MLARWRWFARALLVGLAVPDGDLKAELALLEVFDIERHQLGAEEGARGCSLASRGARLTAPGWRLLLLLVKARDCYRTLSCRRNSAHLFQGVIQS